MGIVDGVRQRRALMGTRWISAQWIHRARRRAVHKWVEGRMMGMSGLWILDMAIIGCDGDVGVT